MASDVDVPATATTPGLGFWCLVVVLLLGSFAFRMWRSDQLYRADTGIAFNDLDTQRRLARLDALAQSESYPVLEVHDGFPVGTLSHWTRPFDWFLQVLNPFVSAFAGPAEGYEPAAIYAGPVFCLVCLGFFLWAAVRLLGRGPGLLASLLYSLQYPVVLMFMVGNGDHQNLQHLCLLVFALLWLLRAADRVGSWAAPVSGAALGLGLWVSTESMLLLLSWIAVTGVLAVVRQQEPRHLADERRRCAALLATLAVGMWGEQTEFFALQWDLISWFQVYPVTVFALFVFAMGRVPAWIAAVGALGLGLVGLFGIPGFQDALAGQMAEFGIANVWLQEAVSEFRPSFSIRPSLLAGSEFSFMAGIRRFTWMLLGLPVCLVAVAIAPPLARRSRVVLIAGCVATLGMAVYEVKLSHLFAVWYPLAMVVGGLVLRDRLPKSMAKMVASVLAVALVGLTLYRAPSGGLNEQIKNSDDAIRELCSWLDGQEGKTEGSVMAPWELGAQIMYQAKWPVVASGYHRNIAGIKDTYRFFLAQPSDAALERQILDARKVRYVVAWFDRSFIISGQVVLGDDPVFGNRVYVDSRKPTLLAAGSLFSRLRYGKDAPQGYRLVKTSRALIRLSAGSAEPIFKIFKVVR